MTVQLVDPATATGELKEEFDRSQQAFGFIPNLHKVFAASPIALTTYKYLHTQFQNTSFSNTELTVIWQTINFYHQCHYCLPAHTAIANMQKIDSALIDTLYEGKPLDDQKLRSLQETTRALVDQRGQLTEPQEAAFRAAGYGDQQLMEIVLGIAQKTMSNYANHLAKTPIDEQFAPFVK